MTIPGHDEKKKISRLNESYRVVRYVQEYTREKGNTNNSAENERESRERDRERLSLVYFPLQPTVIGEMFCIFKRPLTSERDRTQRNGSEKTLIIEILKNVGNINYGLDNDLVGDGRFCNSKIIVLKTLLF